MDPCRLRHYKGTSAAKCKSVVECKGEGEGGSVKYERNDDMMKNKRLGNFDAEDSRLKTEDRRQ